MNSSCLFYDFFMPRPLALRVERRTIMSTVLERHLAARLSERPEDQGDGFGDSAPNIAVIFTTIESTLSALREAAVLASRCGAQLTLIVPQVVPDSPPLKTRHAQANRTERCFRVVTSRQSVKTRVRVCSCRTPDLVPVSALDPRSLVVIGRPRTWWPTRESRMARKLRQAGLQVVFAKA
jgi:hypothetical protein